MFERILRPANDGAPIWLSVRLWMFAVSYALVSASVAVADSHISSTDSSLNSPDSLDSIVAVVNDDIVLRSELNQFYENLLRTTPGITSGTAPGTRENPVINKRRALDTLVIRKIQLDTANKLGIYVDDTSVENYVDDFLKSNRLTKAGHAAQLERTGSSYAKWQQEIKEFLLINELQRQQLSGYVRVTPADIDKHLANRPPPFLRQSHYDFIHTVLDAPPATDIEETVALFKQINRFSDLERTDISATNPDLLPGKFQNRRLDSLPQVLGTKVMFMQEGEILSFKAGDDAHHTIKLLAVRYPQETLQTEYRLRTLSLLPDIIYTERQLEVQIRDLHRRLLQGEPFEELAATYGSLNAPYVSFDLQWNRRSTLPIGLLQVLEKMQSGEISAPFNADGGWHLVWLADRRERDITLEIMRQQAQNLLVQRRLQLVQEFWLNDIRSQAYIEYRLNED